MTPEDNRGFVFNDRPIIGQSEILQRLTGLIELHSRRGAVFPHMLLLGPRGSGKRTIAHTLARKLKVSLREVQAAAGVRAGDLAAIVSGLDEGDVLFLDEIHRLARPVKEVLCIAMKNFELNIVVGKGMGARTMPLAVKPFTCVGAAERLSDCEDDLVRSFSLVMSLRPYSEPEMVTLVGRLAADAGMAVEAAAINLVARLAEEGRWVPPLENRPSHKRKGPSPFEPGHSSEVVFELFLDLRLLRPGRRPIAFTETLAASPIPPLDETRGQVIAPAIAATQFP